MKKEFLFDEETLKKIRGDLLREIPPDVSTYERVGFVFAIRNGVGTFVPTHYIPIADEDYLPLPFGYGAYYNQQAINKAIHRILRTKEAIFSIHLHSGTGEPYPSPPDLKTEAQLISCFLRVSKNWHGSIILSEDSALVRAWNPQSKKIEKLKYLTSIRNGE